MKYVALFIAAVYAIIYFYGGPTYASCTCNAAGRKTLPYYFIGWVVLLSYLGFYWYRKRVEDKRAAPVEASSATASAAGAGTITASTAEGASP
jgi:hypothetical protein